MRFLQVIYGVALVFLSVLLVLILALVFVLFGLEWVPALVLGVLVVIGFIAWVFSLVKKAEEEGARLLRETYQGMGIDPSRVRSSARGSGGLARRREESRLATDVKRFFDPKLGTRELFQSQSAGGDSFGFAYVICLQAVEHAQAARTDLRRLSFYSEGDELTIAYAIEAMVGLGKKLDKIDKVLIQASPSLTQWLRKNYLEDVTPDDQLLFIDARSYQSLAEGEVADRPGVDGDWFRAVLTKRAEVLEALIESCEQVSQIRDKARWMVVQQDTVTIDPEFALVDPRQALGEVKDAARLVTALTEGVGEVYVGR